jgi:SAM-dependent methyltransferase
MNIWKRWKAVRDAHLNNLHHGEGHLGGYVRSDSKPAPSGLRVEHGDPMTWSPNLWRWAFDVLGVRSVLDVGCGEGHSARFFRDLGCDVVAVDGSRQAKRDSLIPEAHIVHDFTAGPYDPGREFDLVWSCEFVEHVEERFSPNFLDAFRASQKYILMTYAEPGQPGWHHVNCRPAAYWAARLRDRGFLFNNDLTQQSRSLAEPGHYREKGLVFVRA